MKKFIISIFCLMLLCPFFSIKTNAALNKCSVEVEGYSTEEENGIKTKICPVCGNVIEETIPITSIETILSDNNIGEDRILVTIVGVTVIVGSIVTMLFIRKKR